MSRKAREQLPVVVVIWIVAVVRKMSAGKIDIV